MSSEKREGLLPNIARPFFLRIFFGSVIVLIVDKAKLVWELHGSLSLWGH